MSILMLLFSNKQLLQSGGSVGILEQVALQTKRGSCFYRYDLWVLACGLGSAGKGLQWLIGLWASQFDPCLRFTIPVPEPWTQKKDWAAVK